MSTFEDRLAELGITLPVVPVPHANYVPAKRIGNLVYTAGQPSHGYVGKLGADVAEETGKAAARVCAMHCIASVRSLAGSLDRVKACRPRGRAGERDRARARRNGSPHRRARTGNGQRP